MQHDPTAQTPANWALRGALKSAHVLLEGIFVEREGVTLNRESCDADLDTLEGRGGRKDGRV